MWLDPELLWPAATPPIGSLAWETPWDKRQTNKQTKQNKTKKQLREYPHVRGALSLPGVEEYPFSEDQET